MLQPPPEAWWIGSAHPFDLAEAYLNFRLDVEIAARPRKALLTITADSRYRLWINGSFVARGPSRSWPQAQACDALNVAAHLKPGRNQIAVQVYSPGYSHFAYLHRGAHGLLAWLTLDGRVAAATGPQWRVQRDPSWRSDVGRVSIYGSGVERRRLEAAQNWQTQPADAWAAARIVARADGAIWSGLKARDVPLLNEETLRLTAPFQLRGGGIATLPDDPHEALRAGFAATVAKPAHEASDTCRIFVFDLGQSRVCAGAARIEGALGGERLLISYAEKLREGELVISDPATYCRMRPTDEYVLRAGTQEAEPFSLRGGRYVIFMLWSNAPSPAVLAFRAHTTSYPLALPAPEKGGGLLGEIKALCARSTLACLQDGFVDSIWRESSQWLGDCVAQSFAFSALSDDPRPLRRAIVMAAEGAYADGLLPSVLPGEVHAYTVTDYNFSWVELLHFYVRVLKPKDAKALLAQMAPVMARMLARFAKHETREGLLKSEPGWRLFLDWAPMDRGEPNLTYNCRYLHAFNLAAGLAPQQAVRLKFQRKAARLAKAIAAQFRTEQGWQESPGGAPASQLGLSLLILAGVVRGAEARALGARIIDRSLDPSPQATPGLLVLASPFMHHYVFRALDSLGLGEDILRIIEARWGAWAKAGEATTWENWAIDFPDGSAAHGFSAHPLGWIAKLSKPQRKKGAA